MEIRTQGHFSAAHIVDGATKCSRLHGHNWTVDVTFYGDIDPATGMVMDFIRIKDIIGSLDHKTLLTSNQVKEITRKDASEEYHVFAGNRNYILPSDVCVILPIPFTTAELIAQYLGDKLMEMNKNNLIYRWVVSVNESDKSQATYRSRTTMNNVVE